MLELLSKEIDERARQGKDVSVLLATRAELLLDHRGALGACLADCDQVLLSQDPRPKARLKALPIRALVFAFLGADELAEKDLQAYDDLVEAFPDLVDDEHVQKQNMYLLKQDCPAAFVCSAADWHRARRFAMVRRRPDLKELYDCESDAYISSGLLVLLVIIHLGCAYIVKDSLLLVIAASCTLGATCAYGFQALTHELGHMASHTRKTQPVAFLAACLGSSLSNFIWHYYYWNYHNRHHAHAGGERDRDGDILFRAWHSPPMVSRPPYFRLNVGEHVWTRWLWTAFFAFNIYPMFRRAKATLDSPHDATLEYEGWNFVGHVLVLSVFGWKALLYVVLSAAFSVGAFGHPFIQFWLTQHAFIMSRRCDREKVKTHAKQFFVPLIQPTCSGESNLFGLWHAMNFGELRHVEHHDFPLIPYLRAYRIPLMCKEFYSSLEPALGPVDSLRDWLFASGPKQHVWMRSKGDFAGRGYHLAKLWKLMQEEMDALDCQEDDEDCGAEVVEGEEDESAPWDPSEDVDDEFDFVSRPIAELTLNHHQHDE